MLRRVDHFMLSLFCPTLEPSLFFAPVAAGKACHTRSYAVSFPCRLFFEGVMNLLPFYHGQTLSLPLVPCQVDYLRPLTPGGTSLDRSGFMTTHRLLFLIRLPCWSLSPFHYILPEMPSVQ